MLGNRERSTTSEFGDELDRALTAWADRHRLPAARAEAIRSAVLAASPVPGALSYQWWVELFEGTAQALQLLAASPSGPWVATLSVQA